MKSQKRLYVNLASSPVRNNRLFVLLISLIAALILAFGFVSGNIYFRYHSKETNVRTTMEDLKQKIKMNEREQRKYSTRIDDISREAKKRVDLINGIIYRKSFSWVELLSILEGILPDACFIVSLTPVFKEDDATVELRLKVASPNLEHLLELITRLSELEFKEIRLLTELSETSGMLHYELSLSYERII